jgi:hypothetical protein
MLTIFKSVGWLAHKTLYFIRGSSTHDYEPLIPLSEQVTTKPPTRLEKLWNKTKTFFGFTPKTLLPTNIYLTDISASNRNNLGVSSEIQGLTQSTLENNIFKNKYNSLIRDTIDEQQLPYYNEMNNSSHLDSISENCEPVTVQSYHQDNIFNTPRPFIQNSMYYSVDFNI